MVAIIPGITPAVESETLASVSVERSGVRTPLFSEQLVGASYRSVGVTSSLGEPLVLTSNRHVDDGSGLTLDKPAVNPWVSGRNSASYGSAPQEPSNEVDLHSPSHARANVIRLENGKVVAASGHNYSQN